MFCSQAQISYHACAFLSRIGFNHLGKETNLLSLPGLEFRTVTIPVPDTDVDKQ